MGIGALSVCLCTVSEPGEHEKESPMFPGTGAIDSCGLPCRIEIASF